MLTGRLATTSLGPMKTLSIRKPWAYLIASGHKDIENRTWHTKMRGRIGVHASLRVDPDGFTFAAKMGIPLPSDLPKGALIGSVEIADCVTHSDSPWWRGPVGFVLRNPEQVAPVPMKGLLGFFEAGTQSLPSALPKTC